jgi:hypothetical protein
VNAAEQEATRAREEHYQEVSLRAVELLAKAQRAADEAVAEAQSYARDLEESAREQYKQILQRAQAAAKHLAPSGDAGGAGDEAGSGEATAALDAQQLVYVRTYARVAHAQLKSVLAALNDELDQLAAMAEGGVSGHVPGHVPDSMAGEERGDQSLGLASQGSVDGLARDADASPGPSDRTVPPEQRERRRELDPNPSGDDSWPPIFAATNAAT